MLDGMARGKDSPRPERAATAAEYVAALRSLKSWSGLAYRQLQGKAAANGDVLPSSTIATTLGRATLPRESFVAGFVRACGLDGEQVTRWLDARERIAARSREREDGVEPEPEPLVRRRFRFLWLLFAGIVGVLGTLGVQALSGKTDSGTPDPVPGLALPSIGSWALIQPARTPELCLSDGVDRTRHYPSVIAVQRPCAQTRVPRVYLEPVGGGMVRIQWHHPSFGVGCLTVLRDGPGRDLLEPRGECASGDPTQRFRLEAVGPPAVGHFRLRPDATRECLSLRDQDMAAGAEVVQGRCSGGRDEEFLITLVPPA
ncbi:XRE family transcriptional regulator [Nocardia panacis]|uniref:XRE family transcriptional regulator n=2 Tax=Nocardia panacis TaxID=2340916 RepID=A0A3A4KMW2_9NOCA|nr:XRE family transcriptional regulator [Nocardia panacis]